MEISFSKQAKLEILENFKFPKNGCCKINFIKGYFYDIQKKEQNTEFVFQQDIEKSVKIIKKLLNDFEIDSYVVTKEKATLKQTSYLYITEENSLTSFFALQHNKEHCAKCNQMFLTGLFITNAVLTNPLKEYQLEFVISTEDKAAKLLAFLYKNGLNFKITQRRKDFVVYTKQSETIEDYLATVGAQMLCLEIMSSKVVKDIRNKVNRMTNCETANIAKASKASSEHLSAINKLISCNKLDLIDDDLKYIANLKLENPDLSLSELAKTALPPLTKSTLNRRLQKICQMAQTEDKK